MDVVAVALGGLQTPQNRRAVVVAAAVLLGVEVERPISNSLSNPGSIGLRLLPLSIPRAEIPVVILLVG